MVSMKIVVAVLTALGLAIWGAIVAVLLIPGLQPQLTGGAAAGLTPTIELTLYAGEVGNVFAFGLSPDNLTSPGPTLKFKLGDVVKITIVNVGKVPHSFAVSDEPREGATIVFPGSEIPSGRAVQPKSEASVIF